VPASVAPPAGTLSSMSTASTFCQVHVYRKQDWAVPSTGGQEGSFPHAQRRLGAPLSLRNIKNTIFCRLEKQNSKIFSPEGPWENVSPGPAVALDVPEIR